MTQTEQPIDGRRSRYHHGCLREALVEAGMELARSGGSDAVVLRQATRLTGVSPNAAYRHFANREELLDEVAVAATQRLAGAMNEAVLRARAEFSDDEPARRATEVIVAACRACIRFALDEPGWYEVCCARSDDSVRAYFGDAGPRDLGGWPLGQAGPGGVSDSAAWPAHPATVPEVLRSVIALPEGLTWSPETKPEGIELALRSTLYGFCLLATTGTMRLGDHDQQAGRMISVIRAMVSGAIRR